MREVAEDRHRRGHHRAGIARADEAVDVAALDHLHPEMNRRMRLGEDGLERRVIHRDHFGRVLDSNREARGIVRGEFGLDDILETDQDDLDGEITRRRDRSFNGSLGGEITPHRVERDSQCSTPAALLGRFGELASAIGAAMAAYAMRQHGLAALRAIGRIERL